MRILTAPGVFKPISDSWILAEKAHAVAGPGVRWLDLCTGSGVVGVTAALRGAEVTVVDVSRRALATARGNAWLRGHSIRCARGHLFDAVADERFDVISANPPYVPSPSPDLPQRGPSRAWEAGPDGRAVLDQICDSAARHLNPDGVLFLVQSSINGTDRTIHRLQQTGFGEVSVAGRHTGPLGPLMRRQQALGTVPAHLDEEDLVLLRARCPAP